MWSGQATPEGFVTPAIVEYHRCRAAAGCGLVIVEHAFVHPRGRHSATQLGVHVDAAVEGLAELARAVRREGASICLQISHAGSRSSSKVIGQVPLAPSSVGFPYDADGDIPEAITPAQFDEVVDAFGAAAERARNAGFSAVEIHGAHGFLLSEFLSPLTNRRDDAFGGPVEHRSRPHLAVLAEVQRRLAGTMPVFVRLGAHDETAGGLELDDALWTARALVAHGATLIDVSGGLQGSRGVGKGEGYFVPYARAVKAAVAVPVIVTGGISDPVFADQVVRNGDADLVGIGRAMLNDAEWARTAIARLATRG